MNDDYISPDTYVGPTEDYTYEYTEVSPDSQEYPVYDYTPYDFTEYPVYDDAIYEESPVYEETASELPPVEPEMPAFAPPASASDLILYPDFPAQERPARVLSPAADVLTLDASEFTETPEESPRLFLDTPFSDYTVAEGLLLSLLLFALVSALVRIVKEGFSWL